MQALIGTFSRWTFARGEILSVWSRRVKWVKLLYLMLLTCLQKRKQFSHQFSRMCMISVSFNLQDVNLGDIFLEEMRVHVSLRWNQVSARVHVLRSTRRGGVGEWLFLPPCVRFDSLTMSPESCPRMRTCLKRRPEMHGILKCKCHAWHHGDWATLYLTKVSKWECEMNWIRHALLEGQGQRKDSFEVFNAVACSSAGRLDMAMRHFSGPATWSHFPSMVTFRHVLLRGIQNHACAPLESFKYIK